MTSATGSGADVSTSDVQAGFDAARRMIDGLRVRDFDAVVDALTDDVTFRALLPRRVLTLDGRADVRATFEGWFGGARRWELVDAAVGPVGGRVHVAWCLWMTHPDVGPGPFLVEQQVYADVADDGRLRDVALLCSGYVREEA